MRTDEMRKALATQAAARPALRPGKDFWEEFRVRAGARGELATEDLPARAASGLRRRAAWLAGPLVAAAAALVAAVWIGAAEGPSVEAVRSYRVGEDVAHGGVMILNDEPSRATILWVVDCSENA